MMKIKAKAKQVPFNINLPWGESIAQQMGTTLAEINTNLPTDPNIASVVQSTCAMVRDFAVKELLVRNTKTAISLSDICYGTGFVLFEGNMVSTGGCMLKTVNKGNAETPLNVGDGTNTISATCEKKEDEIQVRLRRFFGNITMKPLTHIERLQQQHTLGEHNTTGLGAVDQNPVLNGSFIQKNKGSSNEDLPHQYNNNLNGKGFSHNSAPVNRYDTAVAKDKFHTTAQKEKAAEGGAEGEEGAAAEEGEALGNTGVKIPIKDTDDRKEATTMAIPDQICTAICAGLDIKGLLGEGQLIEVPEEVPVDNTPQLNNPHMNTEEGITTNTFRKGYDTRLDVQTQTGLESGMKYDGSQECSSAAPKVQDCLERGGEISHWLAQRYVNPDHFCDQETHSCESLFAAA